MGPIERLRRSPGILIGVAAMVIAVAGVAFAGTSAHTSKPKGLTAAKVKAIADAEIAAKAPSLSVASAANATNAGSATTAGSANPVAFARVSAVGGVDTARSKGIAPANVTKTDPGVYCFRDLGFSFKGAQVTTDYDDSVGAFTSQFGSAAGGTCTPAADAYVLMLNESEVVANAGFFIVFYN